ncbi:transglycosylase domain-containing protein, partial [Patescibacteria group bacterium]|nr:transglycosylase domain-containing protein [Patescibacteria group bacterium]
MKKNKIKKSKKGKGEEVKRVKKEKGLFKKKWWLGLLVLALLLFGFLMRDLPSPRKLSTFEYPESSRIFDRKGKLLYEIYADKNRVVVGLDQIPENLKEATIAIEDAKFYKHFGFDLKGIARGLYRTIFKKRLQGGSTITQQLVKNALLTPERTIKRKIKEALLTGMVEILYSKDQILEMYFNQTPYGGTLWGAQSAAKGIFNKNVSELDLAESSLIAGLPASPTRYSPFAQPEAAKKRQELVLQRMVEEGDISQDEKIEAEQKELKYYVSKKGILAPHFVLLVREKLTEKYGLEKIQQGGLSVTTSLDIELQDYVQTEVASEIAKIEKYHVTNGAVIVTEAKSGQVLAMVGSKDYFSNDIDGKFNVTTALRQPGSSIKPLNYAVGLELGNVTAGSVFGDKETCFEVVNQKKYCPTNYGWSYYGIQSLRNCLGNSLNIPAVKMLKLNGVETLVASASAMGISTFKDASNYGLSLTLGGGEVHMTDMNVAFGVFANMGVRQDLNYILEVSDRNGEIIDKYEYIPGERVLSRETAFLIHHILSDDGARSMVFGRGSLLNIKDHPEVAVKTGTTNDMRDNWTIGFTPDYVVSSWVGNNDNSKMSYVVSGTTGASPIWNRVMTKILEDKAVKKPVMPASIVGMYVCNLTGGLVPEEGCDSRYEYFKQEFLPKKSMAIKRTVVVNKDTGQIVKEGEDIPNAEW